jgi:prepilin-type N-terminal cleavage/methylation domain-containing protein
MIQLRQVVRRVHAAPASRRGFTLIELIVVITIIAILASIALLVGNRVVQQGRITLTKNLLQVLDKTQESYMQDRDGKVPFKYTDTSANHNEFGIVDGRISPVGTNDLVEPSTTFYLLATGESPSVQSTIKGFDSRFIVNSPINNVAPPATEDLTLFKTIYTKQSVKPQTTTAGEVVNGIVIKDPWGNAIRYVHPKFHGGFGNYLNMAANPPAMVTTPTSTRDDVFNTTGNFKLKQNNADYALKFRRSFRPDANGQTGDADEGLCTGGRGYFYSPGQDKDAGTRGDNVYLDARPQFPPENGRFE